MLQKESVKHFWHRLNKLTTIVFKNIMDQKMLDALSLEKLRIALPPNLRTKFYEEDIQDYSLAIERAKKNKTFP